MNHVSNIIKGLIIIGFFGVIYFLLIVEKRILIFLISVIIIGCAWVIGKMINDKNS